MRGRTIWQCFLYPACCRASCLTAGVTQSRNTTGNCLRSDSCRSRMEVTVWVGRTWYQPEQYTKYYHISINTMPVKKGGINHNTIA